MKFVVAATPRSATGYLAQLLSDLGYPCGHEVYFKIEAHPAEFLASQDVKGESSWLAVPFLDRLVGDARIIHLVRDPLKSIRSLMEIQFLDLDALGRPRREGLRGDFTRFALEHCREVLAHDTEILRVAWFYYHWNRKIELAASGRDVLRIRVEDINVENLRRLLRFIGADDSAHTDGQLESRLAAVPKNVNAKITDKVMLPDDVTWQDLPPEVREMARDYGYSVDTVAEAGGLAGGGDCDAALEELRQTIASTKAVWKTLRQRVASEPSRPDGDGDDPENERELALQDVQAGLERAQIAWRSEREVLERRNAELIADVRNLKVLVRELQIAAKSAQHGFNVALRESARSRKLLEQARRTEQRDMQRESRALRDSEREIRRKYEELQSQNRELVGELAASRRQWLEEREKLHVENEVKMAVERQASADLRKSLAEKTAASDGVQKELAAERNRRSKAERRQKLLSDKIGYYTSELVLRDEEVRYRLGDAMVRALRPSKDTVLLPIRLLKLFREGLARNRQRKRGDREAITVVPPQTVPPSVGAAAPVAAPRLTAESGDGSDAPRATKASTNLARAGGDSILFFCVNGAGLGHLTRALAIAKQIRRLRPETNVYFLSSSQALDIIARQGMTAYHIPPFSSYSDGMRTNEWNTLLRQQIQLIIDTHRPSTLVYDGVFPYSGLLDTIRDGSFSYSTMVLRMRHKHNRLSEQVKALESFDMLLLPGEAGASNDADAVPPEFAGLNCSVVEPIVCVDESELLSREDARKRLGVSLDKKVVYIQLGAGNIDDIEPWIEKILQILANREDVEIVLAESPISDKPHHPRPGVHILRHYPNALFYNAFDLAVTAVGYNTFHELMHLGVPSVFLPNYETKTDDQAKRAMAAHSAGAAIAVTGEESLADALTRALTEEVATKMRAAARQLVPVSGAAQAAERIVHAVAARAAPTI